MKVLALILYVVSLGAWIAYIVTRMAVLMGIGSLFLCLGSLVLVLSTKNRNKE